LGRPSNREQRRLEIVHALLSVMAKHGYAAASITQIAKEAGLAPGLVHYHFKNKLEILTEAIQFLSANVKQNQAEQSKNKSTAEDRLHSFIDSLLALNEQSNAGFVSAWVNIGTESIYQKEVQTLYQSILSEQLDYLKTLISEYGLEKNLQLSEAKILNLASLSLAAIEGAFQLASSTKNLLPRGYAASTMKDMLFATLHR